VNKAAASAAQFAKCILFHTYSRTTAAPSCAKQTKTYNLQYVTSWHSSIFGYIY